MTELHGITRIFGIVSFLILLAIALNFFRQQNKADALGGEISRAKMAWLLFAVTNWFLIPLLLVLDSHVIAPSRKLFGGFIILMLGRGFVEYIMLYITKNWKPPMGITHDLCCIFFLSGGLWYFQADFKELATSPFQQWIISFFFVLILSLCVEILYAILFFRIVQGNTTGEEGIWFASEEDPRFQTVNRLTFGFNLLFYTYLTVFFFKVWL